MAAIFTYGFEESVQNFKKAKCRLETLTNYDTLIETAVKKEYINEKDLDSLKKWRQKPKTWA
jgi:orotate phosphoribosyltransferase